MNEEQGREAGLPKKICSTHFTQNAPLYFRNRWSPVKMFILELVQPVKLVHCNAFQYISVKTQFKI